MRDWVTLREAVCRKSVLSFAQRADNCCQGLKRLATLAGLSGQSQTRLRPLIFSFSIVLLKLTGCNNQAPAIVDVSTAPATKIPDRIEYSDWSLTLSRVVQGNEVDLEKLSLDPAPLEAFLRQGASVGPRSTPNLFPDDTSRLALLVNLHNAHTLAGLLSGFRKDPDDYHKSRVANPPPCAHDGRLWSVSELHAEIRRLSNDDWRVPFALFDGRRDGPPLWPKPILSDGLDAQLTRIALSALKQPQIVFIDHAQQKLRLWPALYNLRSRLIDAYNQRYHTRDGTMLSALLDLADPDRRDELNTAIGYPVAQTASDARPALVLPPEKR